MVVNYLRATYLRYFYFSAQAQRNVEFVPD